MTFAHVLNLLGGASFVGAVICAYLSRAEEWPDERSAVGLACVFLALASSLYFITGAL